MYPPTDEELEAAVDEQGGRLSCVSCCLLMLMSSADMIDDASPEETATKLLERAATFAILDNEFARIVNDLNTRSDNEVIIASILAYD